MIVLGIDPGTRRFGWGVVTQRGQKLSHVAHGVIVLGDGPLHLRLADLEAALGVVLADHAPTHASIETLFFAKDVQAASKLGHARGVALMVCGRAKLLLAEYAPASVKQAVAGSGRAEKTQVAQMVRVMLSLPKVPPADAADALALAITHLQRSPLVDAMNRTHPLTRALQQAKTQATVSAKRSSRRPV